MSAWLCSQDHINLIVNASSRPLEKNFKMLLKANLASLSTRYPGRDFLRDWKKEAKTYVFESIDPAALIERIYEAARTNEAYPDLGRFYSAITESPVSAKTIALQIIQSCDSFDYQSCEADSWVGSPAKLFVDGVRSHWVRELVIVDEKQKGRTLWSFGRHG